MPSIESSIAALTNNLTNLNNSLEDTRKHWTSSAAFQALESFPLSWREKLVY